MFLPAELDMPPDVRGGLRLYPGGDAGPDAHALASRELLRPATAPARRRELEPFSRGWFEELELKRYARHGAWLPRVLEFSRHAGERLVMTGPGLGTDALQYLRHGTAVTICTSGADHPDLIRRNFDFRGLEPDLVSPASPADLPFARGEFDLAYVNALDDSPDLPAVAAELYRVLKPGGKVFGLFPAHFDVGYWQDRLLPLSRVYWTRPPAAAAGAKQTGRNLRRAFAGFADFRVCKRHLRRAELPYVWRFLPLWLLERGMGRVIVLRAFKPLAAAGRGAMAA